MLISKARLETQRNALMAGITDATRIDSIGLSVMLECALKRNGYETVGEAKNLTDKELDAIRWIGKKGVREWRDFLSCANSLPQQIRKPFGGR
jgi:DNA-directed RNA polymerase alpha subunit